MTRVKICGTTSVRDLQIIENAGADAFGVIVTELDSPRRLSPGDARSLVAASSPLITSVLVCTPDRPVDAVALVDTVEPDCVQIHGHHPPDAIQEAVEALTCPVIAVTDPTGLEAYRDGVTGPAAVLVDSLTQDGGGGTGRQVDTDQVEAAIEGVDLPCIIAGGLQPENVGDVVAALQPYAVDVASGVEAAPGRKDPDRVQSFVTAARGGI
jgi:phosphoribosylanthranilate isomerase